MAKFKISGYIKLAGKERKFEKEVVAQSKKQAEDKVYALFGSKNGVKRTNVKITEVSEL